MDLPGITNDRPDHPEVVTDTMLATLSVAPCGADPLARWVGELMGVPASRVGKLAKDLLGSDFKRAIKSAQNCGVERFVDGSNHKRSVPEVIAAFVPRASRLLMRQQYASRLKDGHCKLEIMPLEHALVRRWLDQRAGVMGDSAHLGAPPERGLHALYCKGMTCDTTYDGISFRPEGVPFLTIRDTYLLAEASDLPRDLLKWGEVEDEQHRRLMAEAAFGIALMLDSPYLLWRFVRIQPGIAPFLCQGGKDVEYLVDELTRFAEDLPVYERVIEGFHADLSKAIEPHGIDSEALKEITTSALERLDGVEQEEARAMLSDALGHTDELLELINDERTQSLLGTLEQPISFEPFRRHAEKLRGQISKLFPDVPWQRDAIIAHYEQAGDLAANVSGAIFCLEVLCTAVEKADSPDKSLTERLEALQSIKDQIETFKESWGPILSAPPEMPDLPEAPKAEVESATAQADENADEKPEAPAAIAGLSESDIYQLMSEQDALKTEIASLRSQNQALQAALTPAGNGLGTESDKARAERLQAQFAEYAENPTPATALGLIETVHPDRVRILPSAYASIDEADSGSINAQTLMYKLTALVTSGVDMLRSDRPYSELSHVVPAEIKLYESESVRNRDKYRRLREFRDGDKRRLMLLHMALDYRNRLYFEFDQDEDRLIIGYVGKHLPSAKHATP